MPDQPWPATPTQRTTWWSASISAPEPSALVLRRTWASNLASTRAQSTPAGHHEQPAAASHFRPATAVPPAAVTRARSDAGGGAGVGDGRVGDDVDQVRHPGVERPAQRRANVRRPGD